MADVKIGCTVTNDEGFYYAESHEFRNLADAHVQLLSEFLQEMANLAISLGGRVQVHGLKAVLTQEGLAGVQPELVVEGLSKSAMSQFQDRFATNWARLVYRFDARRREYS